MLSTKRIPDRLFNVIKLQKKTPQCPFQQQWLALELYSHFPLGYLNSFVSFSTPLLPWHILTSSHSTNDAQATPLSYASLSMRTCCGLLLLCGNGNLQLPFSHSQSATKTTIWNNKHLTNRVTKQLSKYASMQPGQPGQPRQPGQVTAHAVQQWKATTTMASQLQLNNSRSQNRIANIM